MNYIGSKSSLLPFIESTLTRFGIMNSEGGRGKEFFDGFSGTSAVGRFFKSKGYRITSCDVQEYANIASRASVGLNYAPPDVEGILGDLNELEGLNGFITKEYSGFRTYFTCKNAQKIDAIRTYIEESDFRFDVKDYLLYCLINAADKIANTASVYAAFLKEFKTSAKKQLLLQPLSLIESPYTHLTISKPLGEFDMKSDIIYFDPPYNSRQYGSNYHILETIAKYDDPEVYGKTGMRDYYKSPFCSKKLAKEALDNLLSRCYTNHVIISYSSEGIVSFDDLKDLCKKRGKLRVGATPYRRFESNTNGDEVLFDRVADEVTEYLFCIQMKG